MEGCKQVFIHLHLLVLFFSQLAWPERTFCGFSGVFLALFSLSLSLSLFKVRLSRDDARSRRPRAQTRLVSHQANSFPPQLGLPVCKIFLALFSLAVRLTRSRVAQIGVRRKRAREGKDEPDARGLEDGAGGLQKEGALSSMLFKNLCPFRHLDLLLKHL